VSLGYEPSEIPLLYPAMLYLHIYIISRLQKITIFRVI
jgi:hypothetical protein